MNSMQWVQSKREWPGETLERVGRILKRSMHSGGDCEYYIHEQGSPWATFSLLLPGADSLPETTGEAFESMALALIWKFFERLGSPQDLEIGVDSRWFEIKEVEGAAHLRVCGTMRDRRVHWE